MELTQLLPKRPWTTHILIPEYNKFNEKSQNCELLFKSHIQQQKSFIRELVFMMALWIIEGIIFYTEHDQTDKPYA